MAVPNWRLSRHLCRRRPQVDRSGACGWTSAKDISIVDRLPPNTAFPHLNLFNWGPWPLDESKTLSRKLSIWHHNPPSPAKAMPCNCRNPKGVKPCVWTKSKASCGTRPAVLDRLEYPALQQMGFRSTSSSYLSSMWVFASGELRQPRRWYPHLDRSKCHREIG